MHALVAATLLASSALAAPQLRRATNTTTTGSPSACFPYGNVTLNTNYKAPNVPRDQWWCSLDQQYGFQGFSYPLESDDCSDPSNGFDQMNKDFAQMKKDFGASMVRLYYPACTQPSVFENALKAGVANNMAVIPQIWFGFDGDNSVKNASIAALYSVMTSKTYGAIAPYVFHSADFGSEPIGDQVDGGTTSFVADLAAFKKRMNGYGVPVGISEDWDRPGTMTTSDGKALGPVGKQIKANSDYVHAHVMPFYHGNLQESATWAYIEPQLDFLNGTVGLPGTLVTETQWAWGPTDHYPNHVDLGVPQYQAYWKKFDSECETFKALKTGWFLHAWTGEDTFDDVKDDGSYVIPNFRPRKC